MEAWIWARAQSWPYGSSRRCDLFSGRRLRAGTRLVRRSLESSDLGAGDLASGSRAPGQPGLAARLEYLSTDGPVLSPGLAAGPARHLSTSNLILRREVVEKVGCFDTTLAMCEDRDFTTRAGKLGFPPALRAEGRVTHYPEIHRLSDYLGKMRHYGTGTSQYFRRWRDEEPLARLFLQAPRCVC